MTVCPGHISDILNSLPQFFMSVCCHYYYNPVSPSLSFISKIKKSVEDYVFAER